MNKSGAFLSGKNIFYKSVCWGGNISMIKRLFITLMCFICSSFFVFPVFAQDYVAQFVIDEPAYTANGEIKIADAAPFIQDGRAYVPVRYLALALGIPENGITWDGSAQSVALSTGRTKVELKIGEKTIYVNDRAEIIDASPLLKDGRTYLPARFVAEAFGYKVEWNQLAKTVNVLSIDAGQEKLEPAYSVQEVAEKTKRFVVTIKMYDADAQEVVTGSGVIVGKSDILTNYHVIESGSKAEVIDDYGNSHDVIGVLSHDSLLDLALLRISGDLEPAQLGDSDELKIGEKVVAVGSPLGLQNTVSDGIISAFREVDGVKFIQTTAPISPGSSGGGLFNMKGEVIGLTTGSYIEGQNLNIAIPINAAKDLLAGGLSADPVPLAEVNDANQEQPFSLSAIVESLKSEAGVFDTPYGPIGFSFTTAVPTSDEFEFNIWGQIDPADYLNWLYLSADFRRSIIGQMADIVDAESRGKRFQMAVFYQDIWSIYPSSFSPDEISLTRDGRWLVSHIIGFVTTDEENLYWDARP